MFDTLKNRIQDWLSQSDHELELNGVNAQQWSWILRSWLEATITESAINKGHQVFVAPTQELAENLYAELSQTVPGYQVRFYPGLETSPYGGAVSSEVNLFKRFRVLEELHQSKERLFIITLFDALPLRVPPKDFFTHNALNIEISDVVSPYELAQKLTDLGYTSSTSVEEPGTFCRKGEVFDIFPLAHSPIRIHYFDDMIEEIFEIDPDTQRTIRDRTFQSLKIGVTPGALMKGELPQNLRTHLPIPGPRFKEKFENRKEIFQKISDGYLFENYPVYCPLFFTESLTLLDYLDDFSLFSIFQELEVQQNFASLMDLYQSEFEIDKEDIESDGILPDPSAQR
ncbi:MAG: hypothetical protein EP326_11275, partial [Deltaproteobacteria bacterium]